MDNGTEVGHGKSKVALVVLVVVVGMVVLGVGAVVAVNKRRAQTAGAGAIADEELSRWCELRRTWATRADALSADIALKSVREEDKEEKEKLVRQRDALSRDFGKQVESLGLTNAHLIDVEKALIKEGKVRANISVEIANLLAKLPGEAADGAADIDAGKRLEELRSAEETLTERMKQRIEQGEAAANREVEAALSQTGGCQGIYRGPMTDLGTSESPYVSWQELQLMRKAAAAVFKERIKLLEPREQYANQVHHAIIRKYRDVLHGCYQTAKRKDPSLAESMRLQVRLRRNGTVQTMAVREMETADGGTVDCLLEKAAAWRLPPPASDGEIVVLPLDLASL